jgi:hypothetical protein
MRFRLSQLQSHYRARARHSILTCCRHQKLHYSPRPPPQALRLISISHDLVHAKCTIIFVHPASFVFFSSKCSWHVLRKTFRQSFVLALHRPAWMSSIHLVFHSMVCSRVKSTDTEFSQCPQLVQVLCNLPLY